MRLRLLGFVTAAATMMISCESDDPPGPGASDPAWVGVYTLRADTVRYCVENTTPTGRTCDCTAPGHMEGSLTLTASADLVPAGEIKLRECPPGVSCGVEQTKAVLKYQSFPPRATSADSLNFCAGQCIGNVFNDGGIDFSLATVEAGNLKGWFRRADGNVRACGFDSGPFTATRQ